MRYVSPGRKITDGKFETVAIVRFPKRNQLCALYLEMTRARRLALAVTASMSPAAEPTQLPPDAGFNSWSFALAMRVSERGAGNV